MNEAGITAKRRAVKFVEYERVCSNINGIIHKNGKDA